MRSSPVIELRQVHKTYRLGQHVVPALRGVDLRVMPGELLALTGPSGSGKSTILNLCGLIDSADSGEVLLMGKLVDARQEKAATLMRRDALGFVFQSFNLVPVMTVYENVDYPLFLAGLEAVQRAERVQQALVAVGLHDHAHHRPDALSGGQRQRVAIARALVTEPQLVLADEPTANLDSETGNAILSLMQKMNESLGTTFIFSTHDPEVLKYAKSVVKIRDGQLLSN